MATTGYRHGIYTSEQATSILPARTVDSGRLRRGYGPCAYAGRGQGPSRQRAAAFLQL